MNIPKTIELLNMIENATYPTGSAEYGLPNPSDNDRFCTQSAFNVIKVKAKLLGGVDVDTDFHSTYETTTRTMRINVGGQSFHLFVVPDADISIVQAVTAMVKVATEHLRPAMQKKAFRVLLFRQLRDLLKMMRDETTPKPDAVAMDVPVEKKA